MSKFIVEQANSSYLLHQVAEFDHLELAAKFIELHTRDLSKHDSNSVLWITEVKSPPVYYEIRACFDSHIGRSIATFDTYEQANRWLVRYSKWCYPKNFDVEGPLKGATAAGITRTALKAPLHNPPHTTTREQK